MDKIKGLLREGRRAKQEQLVVTPNRIFSPSPQVEWLKKVQQQSKQPAKVYRDKHTVHFPQKDSVSANSVRDSTTTGRQDHIYDNHRGKYHTPVREYHTADNYKENACHVEPTEQLCSNRRRDGKIGSTPTGGRMRNPIMSPAVALQKMMQLKTRKEQVQKMTRQQEETALCHEPEDGGDSSEMSAEHRELRRGGHHAQYSSGTSLVSDSVQDSSVETAETSETTSFADGSVPDSSGLSTDSTSALASAVIDSGQDSSGMTEETRETSTVASVEGGSVDYSSEESPEHVQAKYENTTKSSIFPLKLKCHKEQPLDDDTPRRIFRKDKAVELTEWIVKPIKFNKSIGVEGHRSGDPEEDNWMSSSIVRRLDAKNVQTASGTIYRLRGNLEKSLACEAGFPLAFVRAFARGFPVNWKSLVQDHFEQAAKVTSGSDNENKKERKKVSRAQDVNETLTSEPAPVLPRQKDEPRKRKIREKPAAKHVKKTPRQMEKDFKTPKSCAEINYSNLQTSSRGRRIKPPLAYWAGEHIVVDTNHSVVEICKGNGDLTPLCSNFRIKMTKREKREMQRTDKKRREEHQASECESLSTRGLKKGRGATRQAKAKKTKSAGRSRAPSSEETTDAELEEQARNKGALPRRDNGTSDRRTRKTQNASRDTETVYVDEEESESSQDAGRDDMVRPSEKSSGESFAGTEEDENVFGEDRAYANDDDDDDDDPLDVDDDGSMDDRQNQKPEKSTRESGRGKTSVRDIGLEGEDSDDENTLDPNPGMVSDTSKGSRQTSRMHTGNFHRRGDDTEPNTASRGGGARGFGGGQSRDVNRTSNNAGVVQSLRTLQKRGNSAGKGGAAQPDDEPILKRRRLGRPPRADVDAESDVTSDGGEDGEKWTTGTRAPASRRDSNNNDHANSNSRYQKGQPKARGGGRNSQRGHLPTVCETTESERDEYAEKRNREPPCEQSAVTGTKRKATKPTRLSGNRRAHYTRGENCQDNGSETLPLHKTSSASTRHVPLGDGILSLIGDQTKRNKGLSHSRSADNNKEPSIHMLPEADQSQNDSDARLAPQSPKKRHILTRGRPDSNKTQNGLYFTGKSQKGVPSHQSRRDIPTASVEDASSNESDVRESAIDLQGDILQTLSHQKSYYRKYPLKKVQIELSDCLKAKKRSGSLQEYELSEDEPGMDRIGQELQEKRRTAQNKRNVATNENESESDSGSDAEGRLRTNNGRKVAQISKPAVGPSKQVDGRGVKKGRARNNQKEYQATETATRTGGSADGRRKQRKKQPVKFQIPQEEDEMEEGTRKIKNNQKAKTDQAPKGPVKVTAGKGTLKRKKQIRQWLEQQDEGYEDDYFAERESENQFVKGLKLDEDDDEDDMSDFKSKYNTPSARLPRLAPFSEKKTPQTSSSFLSPGLLKSVNRDWVDRYINMVKKNRKTSSLVQKMNRNATKANPSAHIPVSQDPQPSSSQMSNMFEVRQTEHTDSEDECDYYWSDED